jgi:DNA-directed RNA polymerase subunit RPC12/RpoP
MKVEVDVPEYVCKKCSEKVDTLYYVRHGTMKLNKEKEWIDDSDPDDVAYRCPKCNAEVDYDELENVGVFA